MAHNPPRVWITDRQIRDVESAVNRKLREWHTAEELADKMLDNARRNERVILTPSTAEYVAAALKRLAEG